jgi:hypothetical protein
VEGELPQVEGELPQVEGELPQVEEELPQVEEELPQVEEELVAHDIQSKKPLVGCCHHYDLEALGRRMRHN